MAHFLTREAAETAAHAFAGAHWHTGDITVAFAELPTHKSTQESTHKIGEATRQQEN